MKTTTIELRHGRARATLIPERGGLLSSLVLKAPDGDALPLLWMPPDFVASESGWPGGGLPICFPFAGRVFHDGQPFQYELAGAIRPMAIHGFAYGLPWSVKSAGNDAIELELTDSEATHKLYPFKYNLLARYELSETSLKVSISVRHDGAVNGAGSMPVALGLHPYFVAPWQGSELADYRLSTSATRQYRVTPSGGAGKGAPFPSDAAETRGRLTEPVFGNLILGSMTKPEARLVDERRRTAIDVSWKNDGQIGYVVLWTKPDQGFHCVEPWMGLPDAVNNGQGIRWLAAGESMTVAFEVGLSQA